MQPSGVPPAALQAGKTSRQSNVDHFEVSGSAAVEASLDAPPENSARRARARDILVKNICSFLDSVEVDPNKAPKSLLTQMLGAIQPALQVGRKLEDCLVETAFRNIKFNPAAKTDERYELTLGVNPIKRSQAEIELHIMLESQFRIAAMVSDNPVNNPHDAVDHGDSLAPEFVMEQLAPEFLDAEEEAIDVAYTPIVHPGDQTHFDCVPGQACDVVGDVGPPHEQVATRGLTTHSTVAEEVVTLNPIGIPTAGFAATHFDPVIHAENYGLPSDIGSDDEEGLQTNRRARVPVDVAATIQTPAAEPCTNGTAAPALATVPVTVVASGSGPGPVSPVVAHSDRPTYGFTDGLSFSDGIIDMEKVRGRLLGGDDHSNKKDMSAERNNCWWRDGVLQTICQFEPDDLRTKLGGKLGNTFTTDIDTLCKMGEAARAGRLSDILTGMEGKSLAAGLKVPSRLKCAGVADADDEGDGETACKNVVRGLLKIAGMEEIEINSKFDIEGQIHGTEDDIIKILKQLDGTYVGVNWGREFLWAELAPTELQIFTHAGSQLGDLYMDLPPAELADQVFNAMESEYLGVAVFEGGALGGHFNFAFPESILQKARALEQARSSAGG